ncbi:hypothetical protein [Xenorhabdus thuongxuanensis]|uniref:Transposase n=2 Tax=Xenorhabdus thuongxuanensis TaxID=1873484 RepID=A0A1Q5THS2_9GAMM|nr:transposase [Xenorhabdus thuongxuanensis]
MAATPLCERQLLALVRHRNKLNEMLLTEENRFSVADEVVCDSHAKIITLLKQKLKDTELKIKKHINDTTGETREALPTEIDETQNTLEFF